MGTPTLYVVVMALVCPCRGLNCNVVTSVGTYPSTERLRRDSPPFWNMLDYNNSLDCGGCYRPATQGVQPRSNASSSATLRPDVSFPRVMSSDASSKGEDAIVLSPRMKEKPLDGAGSLCLALRRQASCLLDATKYPKGHRPQTPHLTIDVASLGSYAGLSIACDKLHPAWGSECSSSIDGMFTSKRGCARPRARDPTQPGGNIPPNDSYRHAWAPVAATVAWHAGDSPPLPPHSPPPSPPATAKQPSSPTPSNKEGATQLLPSVPTMAKPWPEGEEHASLECIIPIQCTKSAWLKLDLSMAAYSNFPSSGSGYANNNNFNFFNFDFGSDASATIYSDASPPPSQSPPPMPGPSRPPPSPPPPPCRPPPSPPLPPRPPPPPSFPLCAICGVDARSMMGDALSCPHCEQILCPEHYPPEMHCPCHSEMHCPCRSPPSTQPPPPQPTPRSPPPSRPPPSPPSTPPLAPQPGLGLEPSTPPLAPQPGLGLEPSPPPSPPPSWPPPFAAAASGVQ